MWGILAFPFIGLYFQEGAEEEARSKQVLVEKKINCKEKAEVVFLGSKGFGGILKG